MTEPTLKLYAHPFSSFCQKVLIALYENETPFELVMLDGTEPAQSTFAKLWPIKRFPLLTDGDRTVPEATAIIEHLAHHHPGGTPLIPEDPARAVAVRTLDRIFDNYVNTMQQKIVGDSLRHRREQDLQGVEEARAMLDTAYTFLETLMTGRQWAAGDAFTMADCAAAPALFYAHWAHPIPERSPFLRGYRKRLLHRPSIIRVIEEARPYRHLYPLTVPPRD